MLRITYAQCHLCSVSFKSSFELSVVKLIVVMLSVIMLSVVMLSVVMLSVIMLSVVAPYMQLKSTPNLSVCGNAIRQLNVSLAI
jgi:hypothetical protein